MSDRSDLFLNGQRFLHRRNYQSALHCFESDLKTTPQLSTSYRIDLLIHIGNIYAELGAPEKAQKHYQKVLSLQKDISDPRAIGLTLVNLGNLLRESGHGRRAEAYYLEAETYLKQSQDLRSLAALYSNFGLLTQDDGDINQAITYLKKSIELHKQVGFEEGLASTWGQLGRLFTIKKNDADAETCFNYAATHFGGLGDPIGEAEAFRCLAQVYERRGDSELVLRCLGQVVDIHRKFGLQCTDSDQKWFKQVQDETTNRQDLK